MSAAFTVSELEQLRRQLTTALDDNGHCLADRDRRVLRRLSERVGRRIAWLRDSWAEQDKLARRLVPARSR